MRPRVQYDREKILATAEALARDTHARMVHRDEKWQPLGQKETDQRLEDRIRRARDYAVWRMNAYEAGECDTPY